MKNSYLLISTTKIPVFEKAANLLGNVFAYDDLVGDASRTNRLYYTQKEKSNIYYHSSINESVNSNYSNLIDRITKTKKVGSKAEHELYSFAWINNNNFYCNSDYLGIFTHYYYSDNYTFIATDSLLIIANLIDAEFSEAGIFDAIFFKKPYGSNTWYKNIYCLTAGNILGYDMNTLKVEKFGFTNFKDLLNGNKSNFIDSFFEIFNNIKISEAMPALFSLSAGSDSRTVLAGLLNTKKKFKAHSWGGNNYLETYKIKKIVKKFHLDWELIDFKKLLNDYNNYHYQSIFHSSGLCPAVHHFFYRACLPADSYLFEGYGGSEFVKGEHSEGMFSNIFKSIIKENLSLTDSLAKHLPGATTSFMNRLSEYLTANYSDYFECIDNDLGKERFQLYLLNFLPAKIFSGVFKPSELFGLKLIEPFFSPKFLGSLFGSGLGIKENMSLRNDFSGSIKSIKPQALILKKLNPDVYYSLLDRYVKYSEWNYPLLLIKILRKARQQCDKIVNLNRRVKGQVDYDSFKGHREMINNREPIGNLLPNISFPTNNPYILGIEVYLTALRHCSTTEFIKETLKASD